MAMASHRDYDREEERIELHHTDEGQKVELTYSVRRNVWIDRCLQ